MQKIITFAIFERHKKTKLSETIKNLLKYSDDVEVIYHLNGGKIIDGADGFTALTLDDYNKFIKLSASIAEGEYFISINNLITFKQEQFETFLNNLKYATSPSDVITLGSSKQRTIFAFKTELIKNLTLEENVADVNDYYTSCALLASKDCTHFDTQPFIFKNINNFDMKLSDLQSWQIEIKNFVTSFDEIKSKLAPKIYKITYEELCVRIADFYTCSLYASAKKIISTDTIVEFDKFLNERIPFVYYSVEKYFTVTNLKKLRQTAFEKINFATAQKIRLYVATN